VRWLADENIHREIVRELRLSGHDVSYAAEVSPQAGDRALLDRAFAERRILLTEDKDFGDIVFRDGGRAAGVVLLRVRTRSWPLKWTRLLGAIAVHGDALYEQFTAIDLDGIRFRPAERG